MLVTVGIPDIGCSALSPISGGELLGFELRQFVSRWIVVNLGSVYINDHFYVSTSLHLWISLNQKS